MRRSPLLAPLFACIALSSAPAAAQNTPAPKKPAPRLTAAPVEGAPARAPLPPDVLPPPPPPWTSPGPPSTSTSGATLLPEGAQVAPEKSAPPGPPPLVLGNPDVALEGRLRLIEARLAADENALVNSPELSWLRRFRVSGYLQPQLLVQSYNTAASPNLTGGVLPANVSANDIIAKSNGTTTNGTYFRLRRARLKTEFMPSEGSRFVFEIDPTPAGGTVGGTGTIARQVEAQGIVHYSDYVMTDFAVGIFKIPFGFELLQTDADRPFIERSWGEQNLTPGEFDTGARAYTTWKKDGRAFALQLAVVNGQTEGETTFSLLPDLNRGKDLVGRMNFDFGDWVDLGVSGYYGVGQTVDASALRFKQFQRAAFNGELGLHHTFSDAVGATKLFAEVTLAQNLDRGVHYTFALPSIPSPISAGVTNLQERSVWVRLEQDMSRWATLGVRWDEYTPDTSQSDDARDTFAVVGVVHFTPWLQTMLEYDHAIDHVHAPGKATPDKQIDVGSAVLQARF
jgi:hypothetical protein